MDRGRRVIGLVLICVSIMALFGWEKWGRGRFLYDEILEVTKNVDAGEVITEDMLCVVQREDPGGEALRAGSREELLGLEAAQFIHKGAPLYEEYFQKRGLTVSTGLDRYVMQVPQSWLNSLPPSIAAGNRAYFFCDGRLLTEAKVKAVAEDGTSLEVVVSEEQQEILGKAAAAGSRFMVTYN